MTNQEVVEKNIQTLKTYNLDEIFYSSTVEEIGGFITCYANLLSEKETGEIIKLSPSHKVYWQENAISAPVAIKKKDLFQGSPFLEIADKDMLTALSSSGQENLIASLQNFNTLLQSLPQQDT